MGSPASLQHFFNTTTGKWEPVTSNGGGGGGGGSSGGLTNAELRASPVPMTTDGLTNTQLRASPVPVSTGGLTNAELRASPVNTEPLGTPGQARNFAVGTASASVTLTGTVTRVSVRASADMFFGVNAAATVFGHFIGAGERLDFRVPAGASIHAITSSGSGVLYVSELG